MTPRVPDEQLSFARGLRAGMTAAERLLWRSLRNRAFEAKFRRQMPIGPYIADFACVAARLIVELDGEPHAMAERRVRDQERDAWLSAQGWRVVRFRNQDILSGEGGVINRIRSELSRVPSSEPR